jgi:hypothetical protein
MPPLSLVDSLTFESRGDAVVRHHAVAPPRLHYVMPAFVPGWDVSLQMLPLSFCACLPAQSSFSWFPLTRRVPHHHAATAHPRAPVHRLD